MLDLDIATGISRGVAAFTQARLQKQQMKHQMKLQENLPLVEILQRQISDPNTSFYERARMIDMIPPLLGVTSMKQPLSSVLGLHKLNETDFQVESKQNTQVGTAPAYSEQTRQPIAGQESVEGPVIEHPEMRLQGTSGENITRKYGDMTPAQVQLKLQKDLEKARDEGDVKKAERIAKINFNLQESSYKANGYKITSEGMNENGEYVQVLTNASGDTKVNKLPKGFKPLKLSIAETNADKPSAFLKERTAFWVSQGKTEEEAEVLALNDSNEKYILKNKTGQAYIKKLGQDLTGDKPITPQQKQTNTRAEAKEVATLRAAVNRARRETITAGTLAGETAKAANKHVTNVIDPIKAQIKARLIELDENPDQPSAEALEDSVLKGLQDRLRTETDRYNDLKGTADKAAAAFTGLQESQREAEDILNEYTGATGAASGKSSGYSKRQKAMIERVRKDSGEAAANLTDDQIAEQIRASQYKDKFK